MQYPPGYGSFPGFPGIPNQQPGQPAQAPQQQPQGYPPAPGTPSGPGYTPQVYPQAPLPPAPAYPGPGAPAPVYPPQQPGAPQGYPPPQPAYANPYAQPGAPPAGMPGHVAQGIQQRAPGRRFSGADMANVKMAGARHPFMQCKDAYTPTSWLLQIDLTKQSDRKGSFVGEFTVLWTDAPNVPANSKRSWIQGTGDLDIALPTIKRFVLAALGCDNEEQALAAGHNLDHLYSAVTDDEHHQVDPMTHQPLKYGPNPLKGRQVFCVVNPPGTGLNRAGHPKVFQRHDFSTPPAGR